MGFARMRRNGRRLIIAAVLSGMSALALGACGSSDSSTSSTPATAGGGTSSSLPGKGKTVGVVYFLNADTPSAVIGKAYVSELKKLGYTVTGIDSQGSQANAVQAMQTFVQRGVDAIAVQLWQTNQVQAGVQAARAAKIPLLGVSSNDFGGSQGYRLVTQFGPQSGKALGQNIATQIGTDSASMLVIGYSPGTVAKTREDGLKSALKGVNVKIKRNELNVTDINASVANSVNAWLGDNPKGSAQHLIVWVPSSCCVVPAANAIRQANRTDVKIDGFVDGTAATIPPLKQGVVDALAADDLKSQGARAAAGTASVIAKGIDGPQSMIALPPEIVTASNVASYVEKNADLK
jgi:ribose transport system substrate-binding protein